MTDPDGVDPLLVALVSPYSFSRPGGVQGQVAGLARALMGRGHRAVVFGPLDDPADAPDGVELVVTGRSVALPANGSIAPVSISPTDAQRSLKAVRALKPDIIHLHEPFAPGLTYALLAAARLPPMVATFHRSGGSAFYTALRPLARHAAQKLAWRCAVSAAAATTAERALGGRCEILFNGVDIQRTNAEPWPTDGPTVLFLGRHEERKGLAVLLEAWQILESSWAPSEPKPVLWIAGDGPETPGLRARFPSSPTVQWLGVVEEGEKDRRLAAADVLVAPSLGGESFGLVLLEGMAAGAVVIASDIEGYRAAAGGCAILTPPGESQPLAQALNNVLRESDGPARSRWLAAGVERAAGWSMDSLAERYEERYDSLLVGSGR